MRRTSVMVMVGVALVWGAFGCSGPASETRPQPQPTAEPEEQGGPDERAISPEQLEEVQRTVRIGQDAITACFEDEMQRQGDRTLTGKVTVNILVGTAGKAEKVDIVQSTFDSPEFQKCIDLTIRGWEFPALPSPTPFSYPFQFSPAY